jgi:hypothetical protein
MDLIITDWDLADSAAADLAEAEITVQLIKLEGNYGVTMAHILIMPRQGNSVESCIIQELKI